EPTHRARRVGSRIITGAANHRNRHFTGQAPPIAPQVKIWQGVASEQPDEAMRGVATLQEPHRIDSETGALTLLEIANPDSGTARGAARRSEPRLERRHVLRALLQRVAGRDQPPHLVEAERAYRFEADVAVSPVRGVERAA